MRRAASLEYDHREENPKPTDLNQVLNRGRGESIHKGMLQHGRASCSMLKRNRAYANEAQMSMPLTEPDLTLSRHPARATARRLPPSIEHRVPPVAG
jgi:hypothetical protein